MSAYGLIPPLDGRLAAIHARVLTGTPLLVEILIGKRRSRSDENAYFWKGINFLIERNLIQ